MAKARVSNVGEEQTAYPQPNKVCRLLKDIKQAEEKVKELEVNLWKHKGALGYTMPGTVDDKDLPKNPLADAIHEKAEQLEARLTKLIQAVEKHCDQIFNKYEIRDVDRELYDKVEETRKEVK